MKELLILLFPTLLNFAHCQTSEEVQHFGKPILDTCSIAGCSADLSFPPCWNGTHHGAKGEKGEPGIKGSKGNFYHFFNSLNILSWHGC